MPNVYRQHDMEQGPTLVTDRAPILPQRPGDLTWKVKTNSPPFDRYQCCSHCNLIWLVSDESKRLRIELDVSRHLQVGHDVFLQRAGESEPVRVEGANA